MTNPLIEKYEELHSPKQPESPESTHNHLFPEERKLIRILERMIEDIKNEKMFYSHYKEEEPVNFMRSPHLDYGEAYNDSYPIHMDIKRGKMINIQVFQRYD